MKQIHKIIIPIIAALMGVAMTACIEDGISSSPSDQPTFSTDTLKMGTVFTSEGTATYSIRVYNPHDKILSMSRVGFKNGGTGMFRLNVDGQSGWEFNNVEIRPNDSIYVFVDACLEVQNSALPLTVEETIEFETNGKIQEVVITADGQDVDRLHGHIIDADTDWSDGMPRQIFDSLVVAEGAKLTIGAGMKLYFHSGAQLTVHGTLDIKGTPENPVELTGDRFGLVATNVPYEIMSQQWGGVYFGPTSKASKMQYAVVKNTEYGVLVDSVAPSTTPALELINCRLRNSGGRVLTTLHSNVNITGCELAEGAAGVAYFQGGTINMLHCTLSNYYLFSAVSGPLVTLQHCNVVTDDESGLPYTSATIANSILWGNGGDMSTSNLDDTGVWVKNCILQSQGEDDEHFTNILWGQDPLFFTDRGRYYFDYRLREGSPAIGASDPELDTALPATDFYGTPRSNPATLGAFEVQTAPESQE